MNSVLSVMAGVLVVLLSVACGKTSRNGNVPGTGGTGGASTGGAPSTGGAANACPTALPPDGDSCAPFPGPCDYPGTCDGAGTCSAECIGSAWFVNCSACGAVPDCPPTAPLHASACPAGPQYTCVFATCDVDGAFMAATCKDGAWSVNSRLCATGACRFGEDAAGCSQGQACVVGPACEPKTLWGCQPNPCTTEPFSCACAAALCPGFVCDSAAGGVVTCGDAPPSASDPTVLAEGLSLTGSIALVSGTLYVGSHSTAPVLAIGAADGAIQGIGASAELGADVVADSAGVYWTAAGELRSATLAGTGVTTLVPNASIGRLALDATHVYFTTDSYDPVNPNRIARIPRSGGAPEFLASAVQTAGIAVAGGGVYYSDRSLSTNTGEIYLQPFNGAKVRLAAGQGFPSLIATDSVHVFWLDVWPPDVQALDPTTGGIVTLYSATAGTSTPEGIALDSNDVYFTDRDTGAVRRVSKSGGAVTSVAQGRANASGIVVDAEYVYWVVESAYLSSSFADCGRVLRIHK